MLEITPLDHLPMLEEGDDLATILVARAQQLGVGIRNRDVIVIGQKAVSKTEGRLVDVRRVKASAKARRLAKRTGKSSEFVQLALQDSSRVLRADREAFIVETKTGSTCLNGGVDKSNVEGDSMFALLPKNPDKSASRLMRRIASITGKRIGVVVCDTRSRPFRRGQVEECIGIAGLSALVDYRGQRDLFGYTLRFKNVSIADELASAAELVMGQGREAAPAAIIRGLKRVEFRDRVSARALAVSRKEDLFRGTL